MDVTQQQRQQRHQQHRSRQGNEEVIEDAAGRGVETRRNAAEARRPEVDAEPMEVDADSGPAPAGGKRRPDAAQGRSIEAGCVTAAERAESNNNNNNHVGSSTATAATASGNAGGGGGGGNVQEHIPAIVDRYVLHGKIDRGTFSTVTLATRREQQHLPMDRRRMYAIKLITQTSHPTRIEREIRCMMTIGGQSNVVEIVDGFRHQGSVGLVMNYIPHEPFHVYYAQLAPAEVQRYLRQLLVALERVHRHGVIHRDVKPSNFLHSRRNGGTFMLVDFGLAQETLAGEMKLCPPAVTQRPDKRKDPAEAVPPPAAPAVASSPQQPSAKRPKAPRADNGLMPAGDDGRREQEQQVVFRNPLKQQQQHQLAGRNHTISPLRVSNNTLKDLVESPLARQIKSTAIGIGTGLKGRRSVVGGAPAAATPPAAAGPVPPLQGNSERENTLMKDLVDAPLARQVKSTAIGVGAGLLKHHANRQPNPPSGTAAQAPPAAAPGGRQSSDLPWCECYGQAQVCNRCLVKRELHAPRAGTPGYRPPEVLLKYPDQTTAVDVWAAGVIFLSLLSKCYPFFGNTDDMTSLAQIISVFGFERIHQTARALDRSLLVADETMRMRALSLRRVCQHYRALVRKREASGTSGPAAPPSGGASPPAGGGGGGADDEGNHGGCCSNCVQPPDGCLCLEEEEREEKQAAPAAADDDGSDFCDEYGAAAYDLLGRLLETDPHKRITAADALQHPYFAVQY